MSVTRSRHPRPHSHSHITHWYGPEWRTRRASASLLLVALTPGETSSGGGGWRRRKTERMRLLARRQRDARDRDERHDHLSRLVPERHERDKAAARLGGHRAGRGRRAVAQLDLDDRRAMFVGEPRDLALKRRDEVVVRSREQQLAHGGSVIRRRSRQRSGSSSTRSVSASAFCASGSSGSTRGRRVSSVRSSASGSTSASVRCGTTSSWRPPYGRYAGNALWTLASSARNRSTGSGASQTTSSNVSTRASENSNAGAARPPPAPAQDRRR